MSKMSEATAGKLALHLCMQGVARYLDCLHGVVNTYEEALPPEFVAEIRKDFDEYEKKMQAAGLPVKRITKLGE